MSFKEQELNKRIFMARKHTSRGKEKIIRKVLQQKAKHGIDFVVNNLSAEAKKLHSLSNQVSMYIHKAESFIRLKQLKETLIGKAFFDFPIAESVTRHFIQRFPNKKIIIIDENSNKAFVSDANKILKSNAKEFLELHDSIEDSVSDKELESLFGIFYDSQVIEERRNRNYALRMMPKKYWKNFNLKESKKIDKGFYKGSLLDYLIFILVSS